MRYLYDNVVVLAVFAVLAAFVWLFGGTRAEYLVSVMPWLDNPYQGVDENDVDNIAVYPNPARDYIIVEQSALRGQAEKGLTE